MTDLSVVANVTRVVTSVVDRITGDRSDYPLLVCAATVEALKKFNIESRIMFGQAAWIEVLEDSRIIWSGCWGEHVHLWVATQHGEVVDLNTSVAHRKRSHQNPEFKAQYSPPILWATDVPKFYRYIPEGIAEIELTNERDRKWLDAVLQEVSLHCGPDQSAESADLSETSFPNEPIICPNKQLLDDSQQTFRHFDRILSIRGIPQAPF